MYFKLELVCLVLFNLRLCYNKLNLGLLEIGFWQARPDFLQSASVMILVGTCEILLTLALTSSYGLSFRTGYFYLDTDPTFLAKVRRLDCGESLAGYFNLKLSYFFFFFFILTFLNWNSLLYFRLGSFLISLPV